MHMRYLFISLLALSTFSLPLRAGSDDTLAKRAAANAPVFMAPSKTLCKNVIGVINPITNYNENYIFDRSIYELGLDTLPQIKFWRSIMNLHQDTAIISLAESRGFIQKMSIRDWNAKSDSSKKYYRDSIRCARNLDSTNRILFTTGKKFFYDFDRTSQNFEKGIHCFVQNNVDPWYAQAILLIESPNKLQKSNVGAYGPFQLMKDVAKMYGLKVNKHLDERADFERSAYAASSLIKNICIPRANRILDSLKISNVNPDELWYKLLVMHIYHAGAYNVQKAVFTCNPCDGDINLILTLWRTQTARFKSASQNYSQLILAAMLEMNERSNALAILNSKKQ